MTSTEIPGSVPASPAPKPNSFQRIIGVLFSPNETFGSIARQPDWVVPLMVLLVFSLIAGIVFAQRVDFAGPIRDQMEQNANMQPDQIDRAVRIGGAAAKVFAYCSPLISIIFLLIIAGVLLLAFRVMGGEGDFRQAFSVTTYAWMPSVIKGIILTAIVATRSVAATDLAVVMRSNLAFLVPMKQNALLFTLLSRLDIFSIWIVILMIIGFAYVSRFSKAKSAVIVISLWVVATLLSLIGPAIQTLRK
jgi:hypothetical protein